MASPGFDHHPGLHSALQRGRGIGRQPSGITQGRHPHVQPGVQQVQGRLEAVAAVVAWAANDVDAPRKWGHCPGQTGHRQACALHQGVGGQQSRSRGLQPAGRGSIVQRQRPTAHRVRHQSRQRMARRGNGGFVAGVEDGQFLFPFH